MSLASRLVALALVFPLAVVRDLPEHAIYMASCILITISTGACILEDLELRFTLTYIARQGDGLCQLINNLATHIEPIARLKCAQRPSNVNTGVDLYYYWVWFDITSSSNELIWLCLVSRPTSRLQLDIALIPMLQFSANFIKTTNMNSGDLVLETIDAQDCTRSLSSWLLTTPASVSKVRASLHPSLATLAGLHCRCRIDKSTYMGK
ncbi:hypothetical protein DFJ58DRAFT_843580 [Suillus subalutaceus]|uniref:uncharacterized protein n=1 Tax=Suillus subalutaceus TaxID=48586 RepID=UPI001B87E851|nr:uncharacterized protein DFJ58DRAFT_843580 [Suillus subalutaceus]KAG1846057.1 hypothetical protein DFJ58DRAFT_843580 [Suillus subalutaceus]